MIAALGLSLILFLSLTSYQMDFRAFYVAGRAFHDGLDPYTNNLGAGLPYFDPATLRNNSRFFYPPQSLPLFEPFGLLGYRFAKMAFSFITLCALLIVMALMRRRFGASGSLSALLLVSLPVLAVFERGQVDILILLLVVLAYSCRGRWHGPLFLAAAISIKLIPLLLLFHFVLVERNIRFVRRTMAFTALIFLSSLAVVPFALYPTYADRVMSGLHVSLKNVHANPEAYSFEGRKIVTPDGKFTFDHSFVRVNLNPLHLLKSGTYLVGLLVLLVFQLLFVKRSVHPEKAFFSTLVLTMATNHLLWMMGMVYYFPLSMILLSQSAGFRERVLILAPIFLPKWPLVPVVNVPFNFILAVLMIALFTMNRRPAGPSPVPSPTGARAV